MLRRFIFALALALLSLVPACSSGSALTELVVVVSADLPVPDLRILVVGPDGVARADTHAVSPALPLSLVLTRDHAPYGPVFVHVEGGSVISDTTTELAPGERRRLDVHLTASCLCPQCTANQTCREGTCADRHIAASDLALYSASGDVGLEPPLDTGGFDAGPTPDSGVNGPTCGCHMQPCCGTSMCNGTYTCTGGTCMDCVSTHPMLAGNTPSASTLMGVVGVGGMLSVSYRDATGVSQTQFSIMGGVTAANGTTATLPISSVSGSGSNLVFHQMGTTAPGILTFMGATVAGAFSAPAMCGAMPGVLTGASASGSTITFTACDGTSGTIILSPVQTCQ
jgi:hypothetical protein